MNKPKKTSTKATKRKPAKNRKKKKDQGLLPYILMGIVAVVAILLILQPVKSESEPKGKDAEQAAHQAASEATGSPRREAPGKDQTQQPSSVEADLEPAIIATLKELGVTEDLYKKQKRGDTITYQVPLDKNVYDLYYANMIIKGRMEKACRPMCRCP